MTTPYDTYMAMTKEALGPDVASAAYVARAGTAHLLNKGKATALVSVQKLKQMGAHHLDDVKERVASRIADKAEGAISSALSPEHMGQMAKDPRMQDAAARVLGRVHNQHVVPTMKAMNPLEGLRSSIEKNLAGHKQAGFKERVIGAAAGGAIGAAAGHTMPNIPLHWGDDGMPTHGDESTHKLHVGASALTGAAFGALGAGTPLANMMRGVRFKKKTASKKLLGAAAAGLATGAAGVAGMSAVTSQHSQAQADIVRAKADYNRSRLQTLGTFKKLPTEEQDRVMKAYDRYVNTVADKVQANQFTLHGGSLF